MTYKIFLNGLFCNALKNLLTGFVLLSLFTLTSATVVYAFAPAIYVGPIPNDDFKFGQVMARAIVIDPETNQPILVRFNEDGSEAGVVSTGNIPASEVGIVSADDYRFFELQLDAYKTQYEDTLAKGAELLSRTEYLSQTFKASDNQTEVVKPVLPEGVNSVFIRAQVRRVPQQAPEDGSSPEPDESLILLRFPFDLSQDTQVADESVTILINKEGQIIQQSEKRIGYRNGFFGDPNEAQNERDYQVKNDDKVFGPVKFTYVYVDQFAYRGGADVSDKDGKYSFRFYMPLCPLGGFTFTTDVWGELRYKNNLPTGSPSIPYYVRTPGYSYCFAQLAPAFIVPELLSIQAKSATFRRQSNLIVDVTFLTGRLAIKNIDGEPVPIGETTYTEFEEEAEDTLQRHYDFNRDGKEDKVIQGKVVQETDPETGEEFSVFEACKTQGSCDGEEFDKQGIFFDGVQDDKFDFPDLVRILDQELRIDEEVGVLKSISLADVRNTDILVFRDATGQLIMERRGLKEEEPDPEERRAIQYDPEANETGYRVMLRGRYDTALNIGGTNFRRGSGNATQSYRDWATKNQLTEPFRERVSDQPRPGEIVTVVAINRATGYMGTAKTKLQISNLFAGEEGEGQIDAADISVRVPKITLQPPNLKIWAEREYVVEKGVLKEPTPNNENPNDRKYLIGSEGASLTSDTLIRVYTEWLDEDGYPLPKELGLDNGEEYGLTGRLAKVASQNTLTGVNGSSDLAEFAIEPGRHTQVIREKNNLNQAEHFYIHVIGKGKDQECVNQTSCPSFSQTGEGTYAGRPALLTPFKVPLFDENTTWLEYRSYRDVLDEFNEQDPATPTITDRPEKPLPSYVWQYRPEYQFSQYDLEVQEINREIAGEDPSNPEVIDIFDLENPVISSSDDLVSILYSLVSSEFERLDPIDGEQELILALGEEEQLITIGSNQTITFEDLESLGLLDPEDFLTIRLYTNNDAGNILWEYAFGYQVFPMIADDQINLDSRNYDYSVFLPLSEQDQNVTLLWSLTGSSEATLESSTTSDTFVHRNPISLGTKSEETMYVSVRVLSSENPRYQVGSEWKFGPYETLPGAPKTIERVGSSENSLPADSRSAESLSFKVFDQFDNKVLPGTAVGWGLSDTGTLDFTSSQVNENGVASNVFTSDDQSGKAMIEVQSVGAATELVITKTPLDLNLSASKLTGVAGGDDVITLTATINGAPDMSGELVDWTVTSGSLSSVSTIVSGLTSSTQLFSPPNAGSVTVTASIPGYSSFKIIEFTPPIGAVAELELPVIVGESQNGFASVETLQGTNISYEYATSTNLIVYGQPGQTLSLTSGSVFAPNGVQTSGFTMSELLPAMSSVSDTPYLESTDGETIATSFGDVELSQPDEFGLNAESYEGIGGSMRLNSGYFVAQDAKELFLNDDFFVNVRFSHDANDDGQTLLQLTNGQAISYKLELVSGLLTGSFVEATVVTESDTFTIRSDVPVAENEWHAAGILFDGSELVLAVNEDLYRIEVTGKLPAQGGSFYIGGNGFQGYIDDVRFGSISQSNALIDLASNEITIGADGKGIVRIQATGNQAMVGQQVGFTVVDSNEIAFDKPYEIKFYQPQSEILARRSRFFSTDTVLALLGVSEAEAHSTGRRHRHHQQGVMVTNKDVWASVRDVITKKLLGEEVVNAVKETAKFIFELTSINDIWVIMRSIYNLGTGQLDKIDGFELSFAVLGVGLTIFAIVTTGGSALVPIRLALTSFKGFLRALYRDIGAEFLTRGVATIGKYFWTNFRLFIRGDRTLALRQMLEFAQSLGKVVRNAGDLLSVLFKNVRNIDDLRHFIRLSRKDECFPSLDGLGYQFTPAFSAPLIAESSWSFRFISSAYAQNNDCFSGLEAIVQLGKNTDRFDDRAEDVQRAVFQITKSDKLANMNEAAYDGLGEVAYQHLLRRPKDEFVKRIDEGVKFFGETDFVEGLRAVSELANSNTVREADGYAGFVSKFATLQRYQQDPIGTIHAARTVKSLGGPSAVSRFEVNMKDLYPDVDPIRTGVSVDSVEKMRRADVLGSDGKTIELKGSIKDRGSYSMNRSAQLEFLNDAIFFARRDQEFEWLIAPQLGIAKAQQKMLRLLGDGNIPGGLDKRLLANLNKLKGNEPEYERMVRGLRGLFLQVESGNIIKNANY